MVPDTQSFSGWDAIERNEMLIFHRNDGGVKQWMAQFLREFKCSFPACTNIFSTFCFIFLGGGGLSRRSKEAAEKSFCSVVDWSHVIVITSSPHSFLESVSVLINSLASAAVWSHDQSEPSLPSAHQQFCCWPLNQNHLPRPQSVVWLVFASAFAL